MVENGIGRDELERAAEEARRAGRDDEALSLFEKVVQADLRAGQTARAVSTYQRIVLWKPGRRDLHERLAKQIGEARAPEMPRTALFQGIPPEEISGILQSMRPGKFSAGTEIVREGDPGDSLFLITGGEAAVQTRDEEGSAVPLANLRAGDFFGEVALLTTRPRTATVRAETPVETLELTREGLSALRARFPGIDRTLADFHEARAQKTIESIIGQRRKRP